MDLNHFKIRITGHVQGVGFRSHAKQMADELGLNGFVRNQSDGSVYAEAEGPIDKLHEFLAWCRDGSPSAQVEAVEYSSDEPLGHQGFERR